MNLATAQRELEQQQPQQPRSAWRRTMLNKVPEVTIYFWVIKILCTTVGETASDYLATNLNIGLTNTTFITGAVLIAVYSSSSGRGSTCRGSIGSRSS
jgi:hypothetical protein